MTNSSATPSATNDGFVYVFKLLRKRAILEGIIDQLKKISQIEHIRHRSLASLMVNLIYDFIAYCHQPKKPSLHLVPYPHLDDVIPN
jgi:hypothetical protein